MSEQPKAPENKTPVTPAAATTPVVPTKPAEPVVLNKPVVPPVTPPVEDVEEPLPVEDELTVLKRRADQMGIEYHPNIGAATLLQRIQKHLNAPSDTTEFEIEPGHLNMADQEAKSGPGYTEEELISGYANPVDIKLTEAQKRNESINDARKLVRIRITCMDPNKRGWPGEVISVSNRVVGTHKKFIPFNTGEPYHVPNIIFQELKDKKCQIFVTGRSPDGRTTIKKAQQIKAFALEVLEPLTIAEIKELAQRQAMAAGSQE